MTTLPNEHRTTAEITRQQLFALLDLRSRTAFGLSLEEFRRALEAGELDGRPGVMNIAMFLNDKGSA